MDTLKFVGALALFTLGMIALFIIPAILVDAASCRQYERQTGQKTDYVFPGECYVEYQGKKIPYSEFKARAVTNEVAE